MKRLAMLVLFGLAVGGSTFADDHVVTPEKYQGQVATQGARRAADLATVRNVLGSEAVARVATKSGIDLARVKGGLPALSDGELHDVAVRAAALKVDPASGMESDVEDLLIIFLLVAMVILVVRAA